MGRHADTADSNNNKPFLLIPHCGRFGRAVPSLSPPVARPGRCLGRTGDDEGWRGALEGLTREEWEGWASAEKDWGSPDPLL